MGMISEMSMKAWLLILLGIFLTEGLCDKTTNINLCCPENQAHMKTENGGVLVRACTPYVETDMKLGEIVLNMTSDLEELNTTVFNIPSSSDGIYQCPTSRYSLEPLDFLIPGISDRR